MESWQSAERGVERMSSNPEKCGRAGGWEEWEERPRGATVKCWETEGGWREEVLAGGPGLPGPTPGEGGAGSRWYRLLQQVLLGPSQCHLSLGGHRSQCHPSLGGHQP